MSGESPAGYAVDSPGPSGVPDVSFRHPAVVANLTGCDADNTLGHARGSDVFNRVYQSANRQIVDQSRSRTRWAVQPTGGAPSLIGC